MPNCSALFQPDRRVRWPARQGMTTMSRLRVVNDLRFTVRQGADNRLACALATARLSLPGLFRDAFGRNPIGNGP